MLMSLLDWACLNLWLTAYGLVQGTAFGKGGGKLLLNGQWILFVRTYWLQLAMVVISLLIGGNLAQQFTVLRQKSLAGRMARFTLALLFSLAYYCLFFYLSVVFRR